MLQMTRHVNSEWQSHVGTTGVTCYTCHRGQAVPQYSWFTNPGPREGGVISTRGQQNMPARSVGLSSLPFDPFTPFLYEAKPIRVAGTQALPYGNRSSIQQAEWTYGLMIHMSESLGVNCTYCHNTQSFKDWSANATPQRVTAWHGIQMVRDLNTEYLTPLQDTFPANRLGPTGDVAKVNCSTCHRGVYKPLFGTSMLKDNPELGAPVALPASLVLGPPAAAKTGDADGDDVGDAKDACPDTPAGSRVGPAGCSCDLNVQLTFATGSAELTPADVRILAVAVGVLQKLNWTSGVIEGHTDSTGTDAVNVPLSERRAETVRRYLVEKGVGDDRIVQIAGFGASRPIADNATPEGRALNRRVVLQRTDCEAPQ
jgi:photosynthetic reaction center cytochrome c subunit